jgi:hypothetical protein
MSGVAGIIRGAAVAALFILMIYAGYYLQGQIDLPSFITDPLPPGTVVGWNDKVIGFPDVAHSSDMWRGSQVLPGELDAALWVKEHTQGTDKFVADIGGAEAIMGMTTRVSLVGGDWANCPDPIRNMELAGNIYGPNTNAFQARDTALESGCSYVWVPNRQVNTGTFNSDISKNKFEDPDYFQLVYKNDDLTIYRVLP